MTEFKYLTEQFADIRILRFQVPGFDELAEGKKIQLYYLQQAALWGRDLIYDQNYKHNILIRSVLEHIFQHYQGNRESENFEQFTTYLKRVWFSNGIHHHYSTDKFYPKCEQSYFEQLVAKTPNWEKRKKHSLETDLSVQEVVALIFDKKTDTKRVCLDDGIDLVKSSANNYYEGVSQAEVETFYAAKNDPNDSTPPSHGMNSKLVKQDGEIKELVWKIGGMYSAQIEQMVYWLKKAKTLCENNMQQQAFDKLIEYYHTGDLRKFDEYSILWLQDHESTVDITHGFIEVYGDPMGKKASYESVVSIRDNEASKRARAISDNALWFEQHSSTDQRFKKHKVEGVNAKAIHAVIEAGDCSPSGPIGINLPNAEWIREQHGSKSVSISNILDAYDQASKDSGALQEFAFDDEEIALSKEFSHQASALHVDLHEIVGHGSGKLLAGTADPSETLKNYASTLEEARADLVALYFAIDPKLEELGLQSDVKVGYAEYNSYIRSGMMTQLVRVELGKNLEESHMRNRQLIAKWAFEKGRKENVISQIKKEGKTYFKVNDHQKLRVLFGELLAEVQRIKSEGDFAAGKALVENYGVQIDYEIHKEVLQRWEKLNIAPYSGFINPVLLAHENEGKISEIEIIYPMSFSEQMLYYSANYSV